MGSFIVFIILAVIAIGAAIGMLVSRNAVHSALFLVLNFAAIAVFYLVLNAPFIAMVQITVYAGATPLSLAQYKLLELLFSRLGGVVSRDEIVSTVWSGEDAEGVSEQAIDALTRRLRERIAEVDGKNQYIITVRGHGFRLEHFVL
ncbi:MAG: NADH-quinone oxidoreductase subunit J [Anaerolineae bacterium]